MTGSEPATTVVRGRDAVTPLTAADPAEAGDPTSALAVDFSDTARVLFSAGSVEDTLDLISKLAVSSVEGCDYAGIFLTSRDTVTTRASTDSLVTDLDGLQRSTGEGPCLDAMAQQTPLYAGDLASDARWPTFGPPATARGARSILALPLLADSVLGSLNLYAIYPRAFGVVDRARGLLLAGLAAAALASARSHEDDERRAVNLHAGLATREVIGQAQGILMERERITANQAFDILRRASQHLNLKLREVAQALVDTGEKPETGSYSPRDRGAQKSP